MAESNKNFRIIKQNKLAWTPIVILVAGICCLLWGSAFPCIKIGYRLFKIAGGDTASQILFAGIRFALAGTMVILFFSIKSNFMMDFYFLFFGTKVKIHLVQCQFSPHILLRVELLA